MIGKIILGLRRFHRSEHGGSQSVELLFVVPLFAWSIFALYCYTDAFRTRAILNDATAVVADALSRQVTPIDEEDMAGLRAVAGRLSGRGEAVGLRVTQVYCLNHCEDPQKRILHVVFSRGIDMERLETADFTTGHVVANSNHGKFQDRNYRGNIPAMAPGDRLLLVQTRIDYTSPLGAWVEDQTLYFNQVTRMRFAPRLCWESCNSDPVS